MRNWRVEPRTLCMLGERSTCSATLPVSPTAQFLHSELGGPRDVQSSLSWCRREGEAQNRMLMEDRALTTVHRRRNRRKSQSPELGCACRSPLPLNQSVMNGLWQCLLGLWGRPAKPVWEAAVGWAPLSPSYCRKGVDGTSHPGPALPCSQPPSSAV